MGVVVMRQVLGVGHLQETSVLQGGQGHMVTGAAVRLGSHGQGSDGLVEAVLEQSI